MLEHDAFDVNSKTYFEHLVPNEVEISRVPSNKEALEMLLNKPACRWSSKALE